MVDFLGLTGAARTSYAIRKVSGMRITNIGSNQACPINLVGNSEEAMCLLDLIYEAAPADRFSVLINTVGKPADIPLQGRPDLVTRINSGKYEVTTPGPTWVLLVEWNKLGHFDCHFTYTAGGLFVKKGPDGVVFDCKIDPEVMVPQSLHKLYEVTGNARFLYPVGSRYNMLATLQRSGIVPIVDPCNYYQTLGMNPFIGRTMESDEIDLIVKMTVRALSQKLHPDYNKDVTAVLRLKDVNAAALVLGDSVKRREYTTW